ncbi:MAG: nicotinate (nicotinamide) nucleotide adenylyltransferase [Bacteroidota bacterium]|nr:nicotinate (nicotinamide) nucleotide adenylyltransferase [Bacteroidota bacterium]
MNNNKVGLYFGSFNPIHVGHLIIADFILKNSDLDKIWFVVSSHNPFKKKESLLADYHRLTLVNIAIEDNNKFKATDIEFHLSQPSYTINTLEHLKEKYPDKDFSLIIGGDNLVTFNKWKNYRKILENHKLYVYPRLGELTECPLSTHSSVIHVKSPIIEISSSMIRKSIKEKKDMRYMLPEKVYKYIKEMHFYE